MLCYHLWKRYVTALGNLSKLPKTIGNRLWKRYVIALGNLSKLPKTICNRFRQPLMETVCNRLSSYLPCYATAYGNGVSPPKIPQTAAQTTQVLSCLISVRRCKTL